ncbi:hypothetical protein QFC21_004308 [Naganishia friedmannii]|uniref:Uncharacterized protein n=1 Tax=Naganishia friedmannii TaxID=89922 RepID=A0ACC2VHU5_9TREE|nr:hypothetical protein QFC21_004308 [Naganishia friedmannii]
MSSGDLISGRSTCALAVLMIAFGSLLAVASPIPGSEVPGPGTPFSCKGPDGTGIAFYLQDGTSEAKCNPPLVCRWNNGNDPCGVPEARGATAGFKNKDPDTAVASSPAPKPSGTGQVAVVSSADPGAGGYATNHDGGASDVTACGDKFGDHSEVEPYYASISLDFWAGGNPNNDPICKGHFIEATYGNEKVKFQVRDKCPGCNANHIDMAPNGFEKLFGVSGGTFGMESGQTERKQPFSWKFVNA